MKTTVKIIYTILLTIGWIMLTALNQGWRSSTGHRTGGPLFAVLFFAYLFGLYSVWKRKKKTSLGEEGDPFTLNKSNP